MARRVTRVGLQVPVVQVATPDWQLAQRTSETGRRERPALGDWEAVGTAATVRDAEPLNLLSASPSVLAPSPPPSWRHFP